MIHLDILLINLAFAQLYFNNCMGWPNNFKNGISIVGNNK
jgi:hypothetical protein